MSYPMFTPRGIVIQGEYWPESTPEEQANKYIGLVVALFTDSAGEMWCAFEMPDQAGVQLISLASVFFKGWYTS